MNALVSNYEDAIANKSGEAISLKFSVRDFEMPNFQMPDFQMPEIKFMEKFKHD